MPQKKEVIPSIEEKTEKTQYEIFYNDEESRRQKEIRLQILSRIGVDQYNAWFKDLKFQNESDYIFVVPSIFHQQTLKQRFEGICGQDHLLTFYYKPPYLYSPPFIKKGIL